MTESRLSTIYRIEFDLDWPLDHVASYLLDGDETVLVDTGMRGDSTPLVEGLAAADLTIEDIDHLVVTHPHVDHLGNVPTVLEATDATVYAPLGVRDRLRRDPDDLETEVRANAERAGLTGEMLDRAVSMAVESLERDSHLLPPDCVDVWVEDGQTVSPGGIDLTAVHTGGHQADHLCYRADIEGERVLLSGDMAIEPFRAIALHTGLTDGIAETFPAYYKALDTLSELDIDRVYPGHGPVHEALDATIERDRRSLDRRCTGVIDALESGARTASEVAETVSGDRGAEYVFIEVLAALYYLVAEGRATMEQENGVEVFSP